MPSPTPSPPSLSGGTCARRRMAVEELTNLIMVDTKLTGGSVASLSHTFGEVVLEVPQSGDLLGSPGAAGIADGHADSGDSQPTRCQV
jgi:hypothetical protein